MSPYLAALKRRVAEIRERQEVERALRARSLDQKIHDWYTELPPQERRLYYTMDDFVLLFDSAPGRIGTALHRLGWERRRRWNGSGTYGRYWVPAWLGQP